MTEIHDTGSAIHEALLRPRTDDTVQGVKDAVTRSIRAVDAGVSVEWTDYFNHSFAPDLVLSWPRESKRPERYVFLRFNDDPRWITEELPRLERRHPVIYGLKRTPHVDSTEVLAQRSEESETLVTDPEGVDRLAASRVTGLESFVGRSLIRGGRGLVDDGSAREVSSNIAAGFDAARRADTDQTRVAATTAVSYLRPAESSRVLRFLHAMWLGSGAAPGEFPGPTEDISNDPGDEGLRFLLEHEEIDDRAFWRGIGASVTLERLASLSVKGATPNLQHLVASNLDRLWARACRVRSDQSRLDETVVGLIWRMELGLLALSGSNFTAYLGSKVEDIEQVKSDDIPLVSVETLRQRARSVSIESLELTNGQRVVTYGSADQSDVASDQELPAVARALGTATVQKAAITVSGRRLELDFTTATISARTSGRPPLTDILGVGLPLLWTVSSLDWEPFRQMMESARDQQTLDLFPEDAADT
jgi:hypothetical protein